MAGDLGFGSRERGGGREALDHEADGAAGSRSEGPRSDAFVSVDDLGAREGDRHQSGAHQGRDHCHRGSDPEFNESFSRPFCSGASS